MLRFSLALLIALAGVANAQVKSISPQQKKPAPHDPRNIIRPWNLFIFSILDVIWNGSKENE